MRNKLTDLNNHLFEQLERLNNEELKGDDLLQEIHRATSMSDISKQIIDSAKTMVLAAKVLRDGAAKEDMPAIFEQKQLDEGK
jgi:hypothetical protein